jgi:hypothetical protein
VFKSFQLPHIINNQFGEGFFNHANGLELSSRFNPECFMGLDIFPAPKRSTREQPIFDGTPARACQAARGFRPRAPLRIVAIGGPRHGAAQALNTNADNPYTE